MMQRAGKILLGVLLLIAYLRLVIFVYDLLQIGIPLVIFGTWRSYVIWGLMATAIDAIVTLALWGLGWISSHFYRPMLFRIIGCAASAIAFILTEVYLWQFIDALYYAGFWEYLWGCILSLVMLIPFVALPGFVFYFPNERYEKL